MPCDLHFQAQIKKILQVQKMIDLHLECVWLILINLLVLVHCYSLKLVLHLARSIGDKDFRRDTINKHLTHYVVYFTASPVWQ